MGRNTKQIAEMKADINNRIKHFFEQRNITSLHIADIYPGGDDSPIIIEGDDDYDTYTLDEVEIENRDGRSNIQFHASSSDNSIEVSSNRIGIELLSEVWEWFVDYQDSIDEYLEEENAEREI